jgi:choline dehydrogenase
MRDHADVAVVGAGVAGCVVAARLAASSDAQVLLLEAGPDCREEMPQALLDGWTLERDMFDWGYRSEGASPVPVRRKRVVGGTGWLTRFALRGGPADYDGWASHGIRGWSWQDVLPSFVALENDLDFGSRPWHGDSGPMPTTRYLGTSLTDIAQATVDAALAAGFPWVEDHNEPDAVGVGRMPMNVVQARRVTTATAYLPASAAPANLTIRGDAMVDRIEFRGDRAAGVVLADGSRVDASHVVLCAGVYGSPAILLRSGIGPQGDRVDLLGVGANLADHPAVSIEGGGVPSGRTEPVLHAVATWHSMGRDRRETPDLMLWISDPEEEPPTFELTIVLLRPKSRGTVRLRSSDPNDPPVIELPSLQHPDDVTRLAEGYRRALDVIGQPTLATYRIGVDTVPAADLEAWIRSEAYSLPHTVGTCAMGSVVDSDGGVFGVEGLSVVDASVLPDAPSGFSHIPTVMLAERLSVRIANGL